MQNEKTKPRFLRKLIIALLIAVGVICCIIAGVIIADHASQDNVIPYNADYGMYEKQAVLEESAMAVDSAYFDGDDIVYEMEEAEYDAAPAEGANSGAVPSPNTREAKIIMSASLVMQTKEFDKAVAGIEKMVKQHGGYLEYQNVNNKANQGYRTASYTARIPKDNLDDFLNSTADACTVTSMTRNAQDVSSIYYDTDSRLKTAKIKLERLQALMEDARKMEDIITIEESISNTEWEIDSLSGTLQNYDSLVDYSTVDISLSEVYEISTSEPAPLSFGEKLSQSLKLSIEHMKNIAEGAVLLLAEIWFLLVIIAAVVAAVIIIAKKGRKHRIKKDTDKQENLIE